MPREVQTNPHELISHFGLVWTEMDEINADEDVDGAPLSSGREHSRSWVFQTRTNTLYVHQESNVRRRTRRTVRASKSLLPRFQQRGKHIARTRYHSIDPPVEAVHVKGQRYSYSLPGRDVTGYVRNKECSSARSWS